MQSQNGKKCVNETHKIKYATVTMTQNTEECKGSRTVTTGF